MKKFAFILLLLAVQVQSWAQKPKIVTTDKSGWHKIAETTVDFRSESDELLVIGANRFKSLKFKVSEAPISLESMDVFFKGGEKQSVPVGQQIKSAGESKEIPLNGTGEQNVTKVVFRYKTVGTSGNDKKAKVELWGLKS